MIKGLVISLVALLNFLISDSLVLAQRSVESPLECLAEANSANRKGLNYLKKGEGERALAAFQNAIKIDPKCTDVYSNLGQAYHALKQYDEAVKAYQKALLTRHNLNWVHNLNLARTYHSLGQYEDAVKALTETIRLKPDHEQAYNRRGQVYRLLDQYQWAIQDYTKAISLDKRNPSAYRGRGWLYLYLGQGASAAADAQHYLELEGWRDKRSVYMVLVSHLGNRQVGRLPEAKRILDDFVSKSDFKTWPYPVVQYLKKEISDQDYFPGQRTMNSWQRPERLLGWSYRFQVSAMKPVSTFSG